MLLILLADLLNGILIEVGNLNVEEQSTCKKQRDALVWVGFFLPLTIYLVIGGISILNDCIMYTCSCPCIKTTHTQKCLWPPGYEWNKTAIKLSTFCGSLLYYIGDNLKQVDCNENASTISLTLTVAGLLLYRVLSISLKKLKRYYQKEEGKHRSFNLCSPNRNETHSLVIAYTFLLTIVIDFDIVFTAVLDRIGDSDIPCNKTVPHPHQNIFWGLFGSMIGSFLLIELVIITIFIVTQCCHYISRRKGCEPIRKCCESMRTCLLSKVKLTLPTREFKCKSLIVLVFILLDIILSVIVLAAVIFFLLADNEQVLQCFISVPEGDESRYRIGFLSASFVACFLVISGFLIRKLCCCVQIKGKITAVNIQDGQQLTVHVQNEVPKVYMYIGDQKYSFSYDTATKSITSDNCNHAELYRNDIERIIKLPQNISTIEEVGVDNINNRITVRHHIQEQHYQEVFAINNGEVDIAEGGEGEENIVEGGEGGEGEENIAEGGEGEEDIAERGEGEEDIAERGEGEEDIAEHEGEENIAKGGEGEEEEDVATQENAVGGRENMIQDEEDLQERQAEFGEAPLHSPVSDSGAVRSSGASEHTFVTFSVSEPPQDSRTGRPRSRSPSPDIKNDQGDDSEKPSVLHVDSTTF